MKGLIDKFQKASPTSKILHSFIGLIILGTILLSLPISNQHYSIGLINNLFVATSATCVTGLSPVAVAETYTFFGQIVLLCLIQIGGLGFITLFMFFITTFSSKVSLKNKSLIGEALSLDSEAGMRKALKIILGYTFLFEALGAIALAFRFIPEYGRNEGIFKAIFISISAFCNAGFDNIGANSMMDYVSDPLVNTVLILLIVLGGIGFTVWFEVGRKIKSVCTHEMSFSKAIRKTNLHTKLAVITSLFLLLSGMLFTLIIEWNNPYTIGNLGFWGKLQAAIFTSASLRTAGFATFEFAALRPALQFIMLVYMITGGSPGGTAGGLKTTTLVVIFIGAITYIKGNKYIRLHNRQLGEDLWHRAIAILGMAIAFLFVAIVVLLISEPQLTFMEVMFEAVSAFATVGLSLSTTARLSKIGKVVIIILMYTGRVGVLTLGVSLVNKANAKVENEIRYPEEHILIG